MKLKGENYEYIKQEVANMFTNYNITGIPVNVFEIAWKMGLIVKPYSKLDYETHKKALEYSKDGFSIETAEGLWIIFYNDENKNFNRINQTIMHEIAHYVLGHIQEGEEEEAEAKFFAKYALASPVLIHNMKQDKTIENIMEQFNISYQAASIALKNYNSRCIHGPKYYTAYEKQIFYQFQTNTISERM